MDIIFGDVMGKGVPAALLAAGCKTEFLRSLSHLLAISPRGTLPQPQRIVNRVHNVLTPQLMSLDSFATLSYVRFDPETRKTTLVDCGNTRLIRCSSHDGAIEYLSGFNTPLGFNTSEVYSQAEFDYKEGDVFVLYSDGATEARSAAGEMFGVERLSKLVSEGRGFTPQELVETIKQKLTEFVGSAALTDDFTCVVIKVVPAAEIGPPPGSAEIQVTSSLDELSTIRDFFRSFCDRRNGCGLDQRNLRLMELAVTEVASNIIRHAYRGKAGKSVWISIDLTASALRIRLSHTGEPFVDMGQIPAPTFDGTREGGFGLFIINHVVDEIVYGVDQMDRQYIELTKRLGNPGGQD